MSNLSRANIFDAGAKTPQRMWKRAVHPKTGEPVTIKAPYGRKVKYVDPNGNVRYVRLTNAAAAAQHPRYEAFIRKAQTKGGGVPYGRCPLRDEDSILPDDFFPEEMQTPCAKGTYGEAKACDHVEYVIERWQAENAAKQKERHDRLRKKELMEEQKLSIAQAQNEKLVEVLEKLSSSNEKAGSKTKRSKG